MDNQQRKSRESPISVGYKSLSKIFILFSVLICIKVSDAYQSGPVKQLQYSSSRSFRAGSAKVMQRSNSKSKKSPSLRSEDQNQFQNQRVTSIKGSEDDTLMDNEYFRNLGWKTIVKEKKEKEAKKENTFIGNNEGDQTYAGLIKYFVPGFVAIWAAGYGAVFLAEISGNGLGDTGGFIGAGLAVFLLLALVGAAGYEVFKPLPNETIL